MNSVELLKVADAVDARPDDQFNMTLWKCGTTCCAVGSYCEANPDSGLYLSSNCFGTNIAMLGHAYYSSFEAVAAHFEISKHQACYLFLVIKYPDDVSKSLVSARIRQFVKDNQ